MNYRSAIRRSVFVLGVGLCAAIIFQIQNASEASRLALLAQALTAGAALVCLIGALISDASFAAGLNRVRIFLEPRETPQTANAKRCGIVLIGVACTCYLSIVSKLFVANDDYLGQDEEAYLITANNVDGAGGAATMIGDLYRGEFAEANRHPLYIGLLSNSPTFRNGKLLSAAIGLASLGLVAALSVRTIGWFRAGMLCALLGSNLAFCRFSVIIGCEILIVLIVAIGWFHTPRVIARLQASRRDRMFFGDAIAVGSLLALSWLTKGTGLVFTAGYVVWLLSVRISCSLKSFTQQNNDHTEASELKPKWSSVCLFALVMLVGWLIVASPLLARNAQRYGSLFYNVNSWLMFVDEYSDPVELANASSIGEAAGAYLDAHSITQIVSREINGLIWEGFILTRMLGPSPLAEARVLPGLILLGLALIGMLVSREPRSFLLVIWIVVCMLLFAWYIPVAAGERFGFPILVPVLMYAALGIDHVVGSRQTLLTALAAAACFVVAFATSATEFGGRI
jgi:hypothetical protein